MTAQIRWLVRWRFGLRLASVVAAIAEALWVVPQSVSFRAYYYHFLKEPI